MSFILDFFKNMLYSIGLWKKEAKIVFLGLDNAGKSTLLTVLKTGRVTQLDPTKHAHSEQLTIGKVKMNAFDLGGHEAMRKMWREYFPKIDAIVYLVDSADPDRFVESRNEFNRIINTEEIGKIPILILGNKIDKKGAVSEDELRNAFGLNKQTTFGSQKVDNINGKPVEVYMCAVVKKTGFADGLKWLTNQLP
jgi:GTP-binding protein SAR1